MAAVTAASTCPESVSRSEPARAAGTEQPLSRRGLVCSCGLGGRETNGEADTKQSGYTRTLGTREGDHGAAVSTGEKALAKGFVPAVHGASGC